MMNFINEIFESLIDEINSIPLVSDEIVSTIRRRQNLISEQFLIGRQVPITGGYNLLDMYFNDTLESLNNIGNNLINDLEDVKIVLTEDEFNKLQKQKIENKDCCICIDNINEGIKLSCDHCFHVDCLKHWLCNEKKSCPICRRDVRDQLKLK